MSRDPKFGKTGLDLTINCSQLSPRSEISLSRLDKEMNGAGIRKGLASQTLPELPVH